jgi:hypothetical protein
MHHLFAMLRLMTHVNAGATIALVAWLAVHADSASTPIPFAAAGARPAAGLSTGGVR